MYICIASAVSTVIKVAHFILFRKLPCFINVKIVWEIYTNIGTILTAESLCGSNLLCQINVILNAHKLG